MQSQQQSESIPTFLSYLSKHFNTLIWACLDTDLHKSAIFYAERYFALDHGNHDARHLYATAMLRANQPHSALHLVNLPQDQRCNGCFEIKAKCCSALGRHRQAREALEDILKNAVDAPAGASAEFFSSVCNLFLIHTPHSVTRPANGADLSRGGCTSLPLWSHSTEG
jgi:Anaphase-promoting complex, cyclosome, subunit 3